MSTVAFYLSILLQQHTPTPNKEHLISTSLPPGVVPPLWGVFWRRLSDGRGCLPWDHLLPGSGAGWRPGGSHLWDSGGLHLSLHLPHSRHRAPLRLSVQLHGLPVIWDVPPLRHHGVSCQPRFRFMFIIILDSSWVCLSQSRTLWMISCLCSVPLSGLYVLKTSWSQRMVTCGPQN